MEVEAIIKKYCFESNGYRNITPAGAWELCRAGAIILDVREEFHTTYKRFAVAGTLFCPLSVLAESLAQIPHDKMIIVADASGLQSREVMKLLIEKDFSNVINLAGGIVEWERDGLALETDKSEKLSGSCMCQLKPREKKK